MVPRLGQAKQLVFGVRRAYPAGTRSNSQANHIAFGVHREYPTGTRNDVPEKKIAAALPFYDSPDSVTHC